MHIKIPKGSEKYILFQRTEYLQMARSKNSFIQFFYKLLLRICSFNFYVKMEALLFPKLVTGQYEKDMNLEYSAIKDYLPKNAKNVLDIGCGVAGIDVLIHEHYKNSIEIYLLDKTATDGKVFYNYEDIGSFYNSLEVAQQVLLLNGIHERKIHIQEVKSDNKIDFETSFDLVISLISWGFHYPVSTYLDQVYEKMSSGGILIIDVRQGTDGERLIEKKFGSISILLDEKKHRRISAVKK
ncbi:MAG: hypothetical protein WC880_02810 [Candidatus Paceibacterota bacterium]